MTAQAPRLASSDRTFLRLFIALALAAGVALPIMSQSYGIIEDDYGLHHHGEVLLDYFEGRSDVAAQGPLQPDGSYKTPSGAWSRDDDPTWIADNIFGGFFDLAASFLDHHVSPLGTYETRRLLGSCFALLAYLSMGLFAARIGGWRAGFVTLGFALLTPRMLGQAMTNPKDFPFAALHIFCLYQMYRFLCDLPRLRPLTIGLLTVGTALAIDIRISGLLIVAYLLMFTALTQGLRLGQRMRQLKPGEGIDWLREAATPAAVVFAIALASYLGSTILWPVAHKAPFTFPLYSLRFQTQWDHFDSYNLFGGHWIHRWEIPWDYLPRWIWITLPTFAALGLVLSPLLFTRRFGWGEARALPAAPLLFFSVLFPLAYIIANHSNVYDEARHVLFVVPVIVLLAGLAIEGLLRATSHRPRLRRLAVLVLLVSVFEPASFTVRNHPLQGLYFSPLIGGTQGAFGQYELDYWSFSYRTAVEWIVHHVPAGTSAHPIRIRAYYGDPTTSRYFIDKYPGFKYVAVAESSAEWDYTIMNATAGKHFPEMLRHWPPQGTVHSVEVDGVPVTAIYGNPRNNPAFRQPRALASVRPTGAVPVTMEQGLRFYQERRFPEAIEVFRALAERSPADAAVLNNLAASYGSIGKFQEEIEAARRAIQADPGMQLARNNLAYAESELAKSKERKDQ